MTSGTTSPQDQRQAQQPQQPERTPNRLQDANFGQEGAQRQRQRERRYEQPEATDKALAKTKQQNGTDPGEPDAAAISFANS